MIVVAIIGILATLAIPNFMAMRQRAMRSEVKANLPAILLAERAYYGEYSTFTDDLYLLAWRPSGSPRYLYGFASDDTPDASARNDTAELAAAGETFYKSHQMVNAFGIPLTEADLPPTALVASDSAVVGAAGNLDTDAAIDRWTMDLRGILTLTESDM